VGRSNGDPPCAVRLTVRTPYEKKYVGGRRSADLGGAPNGQHLPTGWKLDCEFEEVIYVDVSVDRSVRGFACCLGCTGVFVTL
jgi:hypothetical protein